MIDGVYHHDDLVAKWLRMAFLRGLILGIALGSMAGALTVFLR